ncbi:MAG: hypothetical protein ABIH20_03660 [Candidatus Diapherotrites archaeon]
MEIDIFLILVFIGIGAMLVYWGYNSKNISPYKSNFILIEAGIIFVFVGIGLFLIVPILQSSFSQTPVFNSQNVQINPVEINMQNIQVNPAEINPEKFSFVIAEVISDVSECGSNYCFDVSVNAVIKGDFSVGEKVKVEVDCSPAVFGEVEIRGEKEGNKINAKCSGISISMVNEGEGVLE